MKIILGRNFYIFLDLKMNFKLSLTLLVERLATVSTMIECWSKNLSKTLVTWRSKFLGIITEMLFIYTNEIAPSSVVIKRYHISSYNFESSIFRDRTGRITKISKKSKRLSNRVYKIRWQYFFNISYVENYII